MFCFRPFIYLVFFLAAPLLMMPACTMRAHTRCLPRPLCVSCLWFFEHLTCFTYAIYWSRYILLFFRISLLVALTPSAGEQRTREWFYVFAFCFSHGHISILNSTSFQCRQLLHHFIFPNAERCECERQSERASERRGMRRDFATFCHVDFYQHSFTFSRWWWLAWPVVVAVVTTRCHLFRLHPFKMLMHEFTSSIAFSQRFVCYMLRIMAMVHFSIFLICAATCPKLIVNATRNAHRSK